MKISVFPAMSSIAGKPVFDAFIASLQNDGAKVVYDDMNADVAVIWSVLWDGRMAGNKAVWEVFRKQNKPVIVLEVGSLIRNKTWKVGINGINSDASFGNNCCDSTRIDQLGLSLEPWKKDGEHIIVCGQHQKSELWKGMEDVQDWMMNVTTELRKHTDRRIILRPHPRYKVHPDFGKFTNVLVANPKPLEGTYDDFNFDEALQRAWAVISYNSNPGIHAIMGGTPAFVDTSSLAYDVASDINDLNTINHPKYPDRDEWLQKLSYTEWTVDEIRAGEPWDRIKSCLT